MPPRSLHGCMWLAVYINDGRFSTPRRGSASRHSVGLFFRLLLSSADLGGTFFKPVVVAVEKWKAFCAFQAQRLFHGHLNLMKLVPVEHKIGPAERRHRVRTGEVELSACLTGACVVEQIIGRCLFPSVGAAIACDHLIAASRTPLWLA